MIADYSTAVQKGARLFTGLQDNTRLDGDTSEATRVDGIVFLNPKTLLVTVAVERAMLAIDYESTLTKTRNAIVSDLAALIDAHVHQSMTAAGTTDFNRVAICISNVGTSRDALPQDTADSAHILARILVDAVVTPAA